MGNFYRLNKDYINSFQNKVYSRFYSSDKRSETGLLRSILREINDLFRKIGGQISTKRSLPASGEFPSSSDYNNLVQDIAFDIDKLYNAQKLLESDLINIMNFNSAQRDKSFENLSSVQQTVYSAYIRSKKDILGGVEFPAGNPFTASDGMDRESSNVFIDEDRQCLTLGYRSLSKRIADTKNTSIYFAGTLPLPPIYPSSDTMGVGSHWMRYASDVHFIDQTNASEVENYKTMMVDDPMVNTSVGFCEFEAVETIGRPSINNQPIQVKDYLRNIKTGELTAILRKSMVKDELDIVQTVKKYIGERYQMDPHLIYVDCANSFQGKYVKNPELVIHPATNTVSKPKYRLVIPFNSKVLTNQIVIEFTANDLGHLPRINWSESKVFSDHGGTDTQYSLIPPTEGGTKDGRYVCNISSFTYPSRIELVLEYDSDINAWYHIDFYMAHYVYSDYKPLSFLTTSNGNLNVTIEKVYNIFVDAEANLDSERARALNVLSHPNRME